MGEDAAVKIKSLLALATTAVALHTPLPELLSYVDLLPTTIRHQLFIQLPPTRLREMELIWAAESSTKDGNACADDDGDCWLYDTETRRVWLSRLNTQGQTIAMLRVAAARGRQRNPRVLFWEQRFRLLLKARTAISPDEAQRELLTNRIDLFIDVVEVLKVHGRELISQNVELLLALRRLRRLEIHHPEQQRTSWSSVDRLLRDHSNFSELGFFHGKLSDVQLELIRDALVAPKLTRITTLELVSVRIRAGGFRHLVAMVQLMPRLEQLRVSNSVTDFDTKMLLDAAFRAPALRRLSVEHNELEDDAFVGLATVRKPLALQHMRLSHNAVSGATLGAICRASMDGMLDLTHLELSNNVEVGDPGIHALTPMLASPSALTYLDVCGCSFGLEGARSLLLALGENETLTHLSLAQNFLGDGFGDVLADFLCTNTAVTSLQANYVGLGTVGVSDKLCLALESNTTLTTLSLGANRLRDDGACALLRALTVRAQSKPFAFVDLSGNLLTIAGLTRMASVLQGATEDDVPGGSSENETQSSNSSGDEPADLSADVAPPDRKRQRTGSLEHPRELSRPIDELCLLNNDFIGDNEAALAAVRRHVGHLATNEWAVQRQVYDDEV